MNEPPTDYLSVAKGVLRATLDNLEYFSHCDFCRAGDVDDDGGDALHTDECPLYGYDSAVDIKRLREWANPQYGSQSLKDLGLKTDDGVSMKKTIYEQTYHGFESLSDVWRDVSEAFDERYNPQMKGIPGEFQGRVKVTITYEDDDEV